MNQEDRAEIRQMLTDILSGYTEEMKGRYNVIHTNLVQIKEQTTRTNGRVTAIEDEISDLKTKESAHYTNCPMVPRVNALEKTEVSRKAIFQFIGLLWAATIGLMGVFMGAYQLFLK